MNKLELVDRLVAELGLDPKEMIAYWERKKEVSLIPRKTRSAKKNELPLQISESAKKTEIPIQIPEPEENVEIPADDEIFHRMKEIFKEYKGVPEEDVTPQSNILADFGLDSLDFIELVMQYEREFGINIPDNASEKFVRVQDAWKYISTHTKTKHSGS